MIIVGAGGHAKEVLTILLEQSRGNNLCFFDNTSVPPSDIFLSKYPILHSVESVKKWFEDSNDNAFILGLGNPVHRLRLTKIFESLGGTLKSCISKYSVIDADSEIGDGAIILPGSVVTSQVVIGKGSLLNVSCSISHDSIVGDFVELSPGARITGRCKVGDYTSIGTNACILPDLVIGKNVIVGAGAVVTHNIPDNCVVAGVPARPLRTQQSFSD